MLRWILSIWMLDRIANWVCVRVSAGDGIFAPQLRVQALLVKGGTRAKCQENGA
ncbi:MAG: hypothetical protein WBA55_11240 [Allopontixanthobacter sediminis]